MKSITSSTEIAEVKLVRWLSGNGSAVKMLAATSSLTSVQSLEPIKETERSDS